jgi:hypothetical protein
MSTRAAAQTSAAQTSRNVVARAVRPSRVLAALALVALATGCASTGAGALGAEPRFVPVADLGSPGSESFAKEDSVKVRSAERSRLDHDGVRATSRSAEHLTCARCAR